jgi:hypothetical protein
LVTPQHQPLRVKQRAMNSCDHGPILAVRRANRALEDYAARFASGSSSDLHLEMLLSLEWMLRAVAADLEAWARMHDTELRRELLAYGRGLVRLREQLARVPRSQVRVFVKG